MKVVVELKERGTHWGIVFPRRGSSITKKSLLLPMGKKGCPAIFYFILTPTHSG